ncbi:MAG: hypothetical protein R6X33_03165 [Candidatus Brocadiia bacterium]
MFGWSPLKALIRRLAHKHGFLDPVNLLSRLDRFAQPSEVRAPMELLRAGAAFHARGLLNSRVIQNNLDWVWPYWVQRQFDPADESFLPRGFAISHVNLTHRNWTAVGLPDCNALPIVDPRGLLTPFFDGWSVDAAVFADDGRQLLPAELPAIYQTLETGDGLTVVTEGRNDRLHLRTEAWVEDSDEGPLCHLRCRNEVNRDAWLVLSLRPCNPEGVSFVHEVELTDERRAWLVDGERCVRFSRPVERHAVSTYNRGDVLRGLLEQEERDAAECDVGLATAAAMFRIEDHESDAIEAMFPLSLDAESAPVLPKKKAGDWSEAMQGTCALDVPDRDFRELYDTALRTLVLHTPGSVYPGPYTYKRFWFRDAALILHAMLCAGMEERVEGILDTFPGQQRIDGYFHSQDGEWDANGEVLWIFNRFCRLAGREPKDAWLKAVVKGARWIGRKRTSAEGDEPHAGLLPAGFSAEHLGNNDFYYWDDFWCAAGLRAAAELGERAGRGKPAEAFRAEAADLLAAVERSLERSADRRRHPGIPASPYRRMDAGAVGSLAAGYPLRLWDADDERLLATVRFLRENYGLRGAFFHQVIHSGINAYLTLHIAQVMLRAGDPAFFDPVRAVAELASPTGQWPEAIHPHTLGGCMGDGQHVWAAAEWVMMVRNMFVREEEGGLILASGIPEEWLEEGSALRFGPAPTPHGPLSVELTASEGEITVSWKGEWREEAPPVEVRLPGQEPIIAGDASEVTVARREVPATARADEGQA